MVSLVRTTAPTDRLFTADELRSMLRLTSDTQDTLIAAYQDAAIEYVEGVCGCSIMKQEWQLGLSEFPYWEERLMRGRDSYLPRPILLPRGPLINLDSIDYVDSNGASQKYSAGVVDDLSKPPAIYPPYGVVFPIARYDANSVKVKYTTGMGWKDDAAAPNQVMETVKMAVRFLVAHFFENTEPVPIDVSVVKLPYSLEAMLWASRVWRFDWDRYYSS